MKDTTRWKILDGVLWIGRRKWLAFLSDEAYLKLIYWLSFGKKLNLENPQTYNEKLQWLKINDHNPLYNTLVDKYAVKEYVSNIIGEEYIIPTLGVWNRAEDIDFDSLPNQFVLKVNHDSGGVIICKDKSNFNKKAAIKKIKRCLKNNGYYFGREWPYKNIAPKIIAEKYMEDPETKDLTDYKFFCFDGFVDSVMLVVDRFTENKKFYIFDKDWNICRYNRLCRKLPKDFTMKKPDGIDEMFRLAEKMSKGLPCVRMDFYYINHHIYFGEYTLYSCSGLETGYDEKSDLHLGGLIKLPPRRR